MSAAGRRWARIGGTGFATTAIVDLVATLAWGAAPAKAHPTPPADATVTMSALEGPPSRPTGPDLPVKPTQTTSTSRPTAPPTTRVTPPNLVVFGDSVPAGSACGCGGFGVDLASALSAHVTNFSADGLTSGELVAQLGSSSVRTALRTAAVVTVTVGADDFAEVDAHNPACADLSCYSTTMQTVTTNLSSISARIRALTPSATRIVFTGYWNVFLDGRVGAAEGPTYVAISDALSRQLDRSIAGLASTGGVLYTDLYTPFKGTGTTDDSALLARDGDHPDAAGHKVIANAIMATLRAHAAS